MSKPKKHFAPGTLVVASDKQYRVNSRGEWRKLEHPVETPGFVKEEIPLCVNGRDARTGVKCWCYRCLENRKGE